MTKKQVKTPKLAINGWLNIHKPLEMSSNQVVGAVKRLTRAKKVGHAGTLDPLADGVLPIALGEATKTAGYMTNARKAYAFTVCFGEARSTDDAEGEIVETSLKRPTIDEIQSIISIFSGEIEQVPPAYSAIKVDGKRAYALSRKGEEVELNSRKIMIYDLKCTGMEGADYAHFEVECSKGTYIRSLARDMAQKLGSCGYVSRLQRTRVGNFTIKDGISLDFLEKLVHIPPLSEEGSLEKALLPVSTALDDIPAYAVDTEQAAQIRQGQKVALAALPQSDEIAAMLEDELVAIGSGQAGVFKPKRVFNY